jgi:hypothetical protein
VKREAEEDWGSPHWIRSKSRTRERESLTGAFYFVIGGSVTVIENDIAAGIHALTRTSDTFHRPENGNGAMSADNLGTLLRRVSEASTREVEGLIDELRGLRKKLQSDGERIQSEIAKYAELSQAVMQLTTIISDNVKKLDVSL